MDEILKGHKILIVEDDFSSRLYLNKILEKSGAILLNAENGLEAIDIAVANKDLEIILMDIQLPLFDGYEATQKIREFNKDVIIIAQTAYGLIGDWEKMLESGFDDYLIKPILARNLYEKVLSYLE